MIVVITKMMVNPEMVSEFRSIWPAVADESRREADCLSYHLYQDTQNVNLWYTVGTWKDAAALHEHMTSLHVREGITKTAELLTMDPEWSFCQEVLS